MSASSSSSKKPRLDAVKKKKTVVFVLIDGLGDVSLKELDNKTTLQAAKVPTMDAIARGGLNGIMDPVEPGLGCGSDTAHMSILGYDPKIHYRGRGSFEAMGAGLAMDKGDVAFKCNFATVEKKENGEFLVTKRRVDRNFPSWGIELCSFLDGLTVPEFPKLHVAVKYATEHRCGIVFHGEGLCDKITGTDPLKDNLPLQISSPLDTSPEAAYSSKVLNAVSLEIHKRLSTHPINLERVKQKLPPANIVLLRGPGERINVPTFEEIHGMKSFMIAPTCIIAGLGMSLGFELIHAPGATGDYHTNLISKAKTAVQTLETGKYDFGFVHVKAVDDAGHDKDLQKKITFIEKCDRMLYVLLQEIHEKIASTQEVSIVLTSDHSTPVLYGDHSFEPVPFAISHCEKAFANLQENTSSSFCFSSSSSEVLTDQVVCFDEIEAAKGALGRFSGDQVMSLICKYRDYHHS